MAWFYPKSTLNNQNNIIYRGASKILISNFVLALPVATKPVKPRTLFEKLQQDMRTLRLGKNAPFDFEISSKKKDLSVSGHRVVYSARVSGLLTAFADQGQYCPNLSKKLLIGVSEWIYEDRISGIEKYSLKQLEKLLQFAVDNNIEGLQDFIECEFMQRLDPDLIFEVNYSILTPRIKKM